ncbi:cytochrome P450 [Nocardia sp. NPDC059246]|uniref:cytochrome P450 n=1 Tax=unclassified Nocardia TaxID=2637762 RepID=UPI003677A3FC
MTTISPPVSDIDPFALDVLESPWEMHATLRATGPVVYLNRYNVYAMARYEQVHAALVDWQSFESGAGVGLTNFRHEKPWRPPSLLLEADPPRHDAPRNVLARIIGPRALRSLYDQWCRAAEELVDETLDADEIEIDAVPQLAAAFPLRVFPDAVGLPKEGREHLLPYGGFAFNAFGPRNELVIDGERDITGHMAWVNEQCARDKLDDVGFGAQIWSAADHFDVSHEQAPLLVRSLLTAGVDTTVNGIAAVLYAFATNGDQWQRMRARPTLARTAFDEAVRWQSPVQTFFRTATADIDLGTAVVPKGEKILMFLGAANRDPQRWSDPDRFDLDRDPSGHVGFGMGIHQCIGQHVARLEATALLTALVARVESFELAGPAKVRPNNTLRSWDRLPLRIRRVRA